jgi:hypothetical protein
MVEPEEDRCGKCGAEIGSSRRVDFTLKDGTMVCEPCFVKGTKSPTRSDKQSPCMPGTPSWVGSVSTLRRKVVRGFGARQMDVALRRQLNMWVRGEGRVCVSFLR